MLVCKLFVLTKLKFLSFEDSENQKFLHKPKVPVVNTCQNPLILIRCLEKDTEFIKRRMRLHKVFRGTVPKVG